MKQEQNFRQRLFDENTRFDNGTTILNGLNFDQLKKLIAILLTFLFVFSTLYPALAADEFIPDAPTVDVPTKSTPAPTEPAPEPTLSDILNDIVNNPSTLSEETLNSPAVDSTLIVDPGPVPDPNVTEDSGQTIPDSPTAEEPAPTDESKPEDMGEAVEKPLQESLTSLLDSGSDAATIITPDSTSPKKTSNFQADKSTGALTYEYPIYTPPGRLGFTPNVSLRYNSQNLDNFNIAGYGWGINIPYIQRENLTGTNELYSSFNFTSSLSGSLATTTTATSSPINFAAKIENGDFLSYTFNASTSVWTVLDKQGWTYVFGTTTAERQDNPNDSSQVFKWMLSLITEPNGNSIAYSYVKDQGQIYPKTITYSNYGGSPGLYSVNFATSTSVRADNLVSYATGFKVKTNYTIDQIQTKASGTAIRTYTLAYTSGNNGLRSVLSSITESGYNPDSGNTVNLPPVNFTYGAGGASSGASWTIPTFIDNVHTRVGDVNADGRADILVSYTVDATSTNHTYINNGSGWTLDSNWSIPVAFAVKTGSTEIAKQAALLDINADGKDDIVYCASSAGTPQTYFNNGSGWTNVTFSWTAPCTYPNNNGGTNSVFGDLNADGLVDYITGSTLVANRGLGWNSVSSINTSTTPLTLTDGSGYDTGTRLFDFNGDGLADLSRHQTVTGGSPNLSAYFHTGIGDWQKDTDLESPQAFSNYNGAGPTVTLSTRPVYDVSADGLVDYVSPNCLYGTGEGEGTPASPACGQPTDYDANINGIVFWNLGDANADGLLDYISTNCTNPGGCTISSPTDDYTSNVSVNTLGKQDLLKTVTKQTGATTYVTYKPADQYTSGGAFVNTTSPSSIYTVQNIATADSVASTTQSTTYFYSGGKYLYNGPFDRQSGGFAQVDETDTQGNKTSTYFLQPDSSYNTYSIVASTTPFGLYNYTQSWIGKISKIEAYSGTSTLLTRTINTWATTTASTTLASTRHFPYLAQTLTMSYEGDSSHSDKAESYTYATTIGNLLSKIEWGKVTGSTDGTFSDTGSDKFTTTYTYATSSTSTLMSLLSSQSTIDQNSNKVRETKNYYDALSFGAVNKGNLTKQEMWKVSSTYIDTEKTYNSYGLVTQEKDPRDKATNYTYEANNLYPATVTNPLSQVTQYAYTYAMGKVATTTDPNGNIFTNSYDGIGRLLEQKQPNPTTTSTLETKLAFTYTDAKNGTKIQESKYLTSTSTADSYVYFDGLGRKRQERTEAEGSYFAVRDFAYNNVGLLQKETLPYFGTGSATTTPATSTPLYINYYYDALHRLATTTNAVGTTTNAYLDWRTTTTDARGKAKDFYFDAYNNLIQVDERVNASSTAASTTPPTELFNTSLYNDANLVGYWRLENTTASVGPNLTNNNSVSFNAAKYNNGADYGSSNTNKYLDAANNLGITGGSISMSAWVKLSSEPGANVNFAFVNQTDSTNDIRYTLDYYQSAGSYHLIFIRHKGSDEYADYVVSGGLGTSNWHHVAGTYDGANLRLYLDGSLVAGPSAASGNGSSQPNSFNIGNAVNVSSQIYFTSGIIDDVAIFNRALISGEISDIYNGTSTPAVEGSYDIQSTYYEYDGNKNLSKITDAYGNIRNFTYDGLSRRLTTQDLHSSGDATYGSYTYTYDDAGNQTQKVDPKSQTINYTYDDVNRPLTEDYTGTGGTEVMYTYDSCTQGKGHLCTASSTAVTLANAYDALGRITTSTSTINSTAYSTSYTYDRQGSQLSITSPDSSKVKYEYNNAGQVETVQRKESTDGSYQDLVTDLDYGPHGKITYQANANCTETFNTYSATAMYRLTNKLTETCGTVSMMSMFRPLPPKQPKEEPKEKIEEPYIPPPTATSTPPSLSTTTPPTIPSTTSSTLVSLNSESSGFFGKAFNWIASGISSIVKELAKGVNKGVKFIAGIIKTAYAAATELFDTPLYSDPYLVGYYKLENATSTIGPNLTNNNSVAFNAAKFNNGADYGSANSNKYLDAANNLGITGGSISMTAWVKLSAEPGNNVNFTFVNQTDSTNDIRYTLDYYLSAGSYHLIFIRHKGSDQYADYVVSGGLGTSNWRHMAGTYDGTDVRVYLDGSLVAGPSAASGNGNSQPNSFNIGNANNVSSQIYFTSGIIDDVGVFSRALTDNEVLGLYTGDFTTGIQDLTYTYDANGNITQIEDTSETNIAKTVTYTYDDLNRLTNASSTLAATSTNYRYSYTYDALGSIQTRVENNATTTYSYATSTLAYLNPHAVATTTAASTTNFTYDNNGNLTSTKVGTSTIASYTWDYNNRMTQAVTGTTATSTSAYDPWGQRVKQTVATTSTTSTYYPSKFYNTNGTTPTKHIFLPNGEMIATVIGTGATTTVQYIHPDHLGGTNVVTNSDGEISELSDFYPYGTARLDEQSGHNEQRKAFGHEYDNTTGLIYANARYYNGTNGGFISQDPRFIQVGFDLKDPQSMNSYAYALNNPLKYIDPNGEWPTLAQTVNFFDRTNPLNYIYGPAVNEISTGIQTGNFGQFAQGVADVAVNTVIIADSAFTLGTIIGAPIAAEQYNLRLQGQIQKGQEFVNNSANNVQKTYQVYEKVNPETGQVYVGRTSGVKAPEANVKSRDYGHHMSEKGYGLAQLKYSSDNSDAIRGQEQIRIDANKTQGNSGNAINGISPNNFNWTRYINAAWKAFGGGKEMK